MRDEKLLHLLASKEHAELPNGKSETLGGIVKYLTHPTTRRQLNRHKPIWHKQCVKLLLFNVWCPKCRHEVTITNFTGAVRAKDLLLVGKCSVCRGDVARVIELEG